MPVFNSRVLAPSQSPSSHGTGAGLGPPLGIVRSAACATWPPTQADTAERPSQRQNAVGCFARSPDDAIMTTLPGSILQRVGDDVITALGAERAVAAGRGDDILLAVDLVAHRRRLGTSWQAIFPDHLAVTHVVSPDRVLIGSGVECDPTGSSDRPTQHRHAHLERKG